MVLSSEVIVTSGTTVTADSTVSDGFSETEILHASFSVEIELLDKQSVKSKVKGINQ